MKTERICCVCVTVGDRVLVLERSPTDPSFPLWWNLPGGHAEDGETPRQAAARELGEEAGIWVDPRCLKFRNLFLIGHKAIYCYTLDLIAFPTVSLNFEHSRFLWCNDQMRTHLRLLPLVEDMVKS